jgi:hypothetical protein
MHRKINGRAKVNGVALVLLSALGLPATVLADEPPHIGNIWGGVNHQPTPAEEQALARAKGIRIEQNSAEQRRELDEINALNRQLLGKDDDTQARRPDAPPASALASRQNRGSRERHRPSR